MCMHNLVLMPMNFLGHHLEMLSQNHMILYYISYESPMHTESLNLYFVVGETQEISYEEINKR